MADLVYLGAAALAGATLMHFMHPNQMPLFYRPIRGGGDLKQQTREMYSMTKAAAVVAEKLQPIRAEHVHSHTLKEARDFWEREDSQYAKKKFRQQVRL